MRSSGKHHCNLVGNGHALYIAVRENQMRTFLMLVTCLSYFAALLASVMSQWIASGVFATCGTVAIVGVALLDEITVLAAGQPGGE